MKADFLQVFKNKVSTLGNSGLLVKKQSNFKAESKSLFSKNLQQCLDYQRKSIHKKKSVTKEVPGEYAQSLNTKSREGLQHKLLLPKISNRYAYSDADKNSDCKKGRKQLQKHVSLPRLDNKNFKQFLSERIRQIGNNSRQTVESREPPKSLIEKGSRVVLPKILRRQSRIESFQKGLFHNPANSPIVQLKNSIRDQKSNSVLGSQLKAGALKQHRKSPQRLKQEFGQFIIDSVRQQVYKHLNILNEVQKIAVKK